MSKVSGLGLLEVFWDAEKPPLHEDEIITCALYSSFAKHLSLTFVGALTNMQIMYSHYSQNQTVPMDELRLGI